MKPHWNNALVCLSVLVLSYFYYTDFAGQVSNENKVMINIFITPFVLGLIAGALCRGDFVLRLIYIIPIPIITVLLLETDPAKQGLELVLIGPWLALYILGLAVSYNSLRLICKFLNNKQI